MIPTNLNTKINHLAFESGAKYLGKVYKPCHFYKKNCNSICLCKGNGKSEISMCIYS